MRINVKLLSQVSLEELRRLALDLEIIAMKEIPHDERMIKLLGSPEVTEREVHADSQRRYRVQDYASGKDASEIMTRMCVASAYFGSEDLKS